MPPPKCHLLRSNGGIEAGDMHHASPIGRFKSDEERVAVVRTSLSLGPLDDLMTATQSEHIFAALEYDVGGAQDVQNHCSSSWLRPVRWRRLAVVD